MKRVEAPKPVQNITISDCTITAGPTAPAVTAVECLARAAEANAKAIRACAKALGKPYMECGIRVGT